MMSVMPPGVEMVLYGADLRQPRWPKPHVQRSHGFWYLVDVGPRSSGTWRQLEPITSDPRPKAPRPHV